MRSSYSFTTVVRGLQSSVAPLVIAILLLATRGITTPEIWGDLAIGREIFREGLPRVDTTIRAGPNREWMDLRWLYHVMLYAVWSVGGAWGSMLLKALATTAAVATTVAAARKRPRASWPATMAALLLLWVVAPRWELSAALLCVPLAAGIVLLAELQPSIPWLYGLGVPIQVLWVNLDPSGWLGPILAAGSWFLSRPLRGVGFDHRRARWMWPAALALASAVVHPYGPRHVIWAFAHWREYVSPVAFATWPQTFASPNPWIRVVAGYLAPLLVTLGFVTADYPRQAPTLARALVGIAILLYAPSLTPIGWMVLVPCVTDVLEAVLQWWTHASWSRWSRTRTSEDGLRMRDVEVGWPLAVACLVLMIVNLRNSDPFCVWGRPLATDHLPFSVSSALQRAGLSGEQLFCFPSDGAVLAWELADSRVYCDLQPARSVSTNFPDWTEFLQSPSEAFVRRLRSAGLHAFVLPLSSPAALAWLDRERRPSGCSLVYFDGLHVIFALTNSPFAAQALSQVLRREGLAALRKEADPFATAARAGRRLRPPPRVVGAALYYLSVGHYSHAAEALELIRLAGYRPPELDLLLARAYLGMLQPVRATEAAQRFMSRRPRSTSGWQILAQALAAAGRTNDARRVLERIGASGRDRGQ